MNASTITEPAYSQETALIVNSQKEDRETLRRFFSNADYHVIGAATGGEAIELCRNYAGAIHVLVTDTDLRGLSGWALAEKAAKIRPGLVVLFLSARYVSQELDASLSEKRPPTVLPNRIRPETLLRITQALGHAKPASIGAKLVS